jgi:hypothetical protein
MEINEKIALLFDAAIGGLNAKQDWIVEKLTFFFRTRREQMKMIDETCRDLMAERKIAYTEELNDAKDSAIEDMAQCREDYITDLLTLKEGLKTGLKELINQTIWDIKELKVEGLLNEAGMPTEEHSAQITMMIE